jgi:SAM-dependent methyltransferase
MTSPLAVADHAPIVAERESSRLAENGPAARRWPVWSLLVAEPDFVRVTRASYDLIAPEYARRFGAQLPAKPLDNAMITGFAGLVLGAGGGPVADVGCGTGRVTARLHELGLDVSGTDLSPGMLQMARQAYPHIRFSEGSMLALDVPAGSLAGLVAWYCVIHVPHELHGEVFAGFARALAPGGYLLAGFQAGDDTLHRAEAYGHQIDLDFRRLRPDWVAGQVAGAGLEVYARLLREPDLDGDFPEATPQAIVIARKPPA